MNAEADLPIRVEDADVGECCVELFVRGMQILNEAYQGLAMAFYGGTDGTATRQSADVLLQLLRRLEERPISVEDKEAG